MEMIVNHDADGCTKTQNHQKALRKTQKYNNLLKTKRILNTKIEASWGSVFTFILPGGVSHPCPPSVTPLLVRIWN